MMIMLMCRMVSISVLGVIIYQSINQSRDYDDDDDNDDNDDNDDDDDDDDDDDADDNDDDDDSDTCQGIVEPSGNTTQARSSYLPEEILWAHRSLS